MSAPGASNLWYEVPLISCRVSGTGITATKVANGEFVDAPRLDASGNVDDDPVPLTRHDFKRPRYQRLLAPGGARTSGYPLCAADAAYDSPSEAT